MEPAAKGTSPPFPWRGLMALFLGERRLAPRDFWSLTLPEIAAVVGPVSDNRPRRTDLMRLMEAFPDG